MKDYSVCSDFEINKAVDDILFPPKYRVVKGYNRRYCTEPNHAWSIITSYGISLMFDGVWQAGINLTIDAGGLCDWEHGYTDTNPLRAAMIVYLMMMDAKT